MKTSNNALLEYPLIEVDLRQAVFALAEALSLVGIDEHQHGERVAYMAITCAQQLGWNSERLDDLLHASLLHDCGVSSSRTHKKLISELDWSGAEAHCVLGEHYLNSFPPLCHLAPIVRYHHTHWSRLQQLGLHQSQQEASNLIYLVDRIDAMQVQLGAQGMGCDEIPRLVREWVSDSSREIFSPGLADAFLKVSRGEAFWLNMEPVHLSEFMFHKEKQGEPVKLGRYEDLYRLARIFAHIVDAKSNFTFDHSLGVAQVSRELAVLLELPSSRVALIELAGLLHDLGKLGVADEILEKQGPLNEHESVQMHRHSYETFRILNRIEGFEQIAEWAGNHHETLIGDGYPFQHDGTELALEARIIAVADIFQALAQDRPYRKAMAADAIINHITELGGQGKIDAGLVQLAAEHRQKLFTAATVIQNDWLPTSIVS